MSRMSIVCFFTIGVVPLGIVNVTSTRTSWLSPRVLDGDVEGEIRRGLDRRLRVGRELGAGRLHDDLLEPGAVDAGRRAAGRGTVDAEPDRRHRARRVELDVLDEHRGGRRHVADALVLHRRLGRDAEEHLPDDVARIEQARLLGQLLAGGRRVLRVVVLRRLERLEQPLHAADAQAERLDGMIGRRAQRPRHVDARRVVDVLLLPVDQPLQRRLELGLLEPRRRQELGQAGADLGRVGADRAELRHRVRVVVALLVARAALRPEHEQHDDENRERDEPDQPEDRRHAVRRLELGPPRALRHRLRRRRRRAAAPRHAGARRFTGCVVVEEVEVEVVVVVRAHRFCSLRGLRESTPCFGPEGRSPAAAKWRGPCRAPRTPFPTPDLVLDRYRPLRPLGRGGSGSVWLARDERTGLEVALKIVPREGKRASRAAREMEAASRLRHERCVRAYDFGGDSGHVYIAYEYVQGSTLRETLRSGKLGDRDAVEASAQILDALAHAHRIGIVHRDVKPSNVLVEETPTISIRLLDFGLAQFDEADTLTAVGDVPGTLAYIAPERLRGGDATAASDVWAVGVLLWEALVGEHPFWGVPLPQVAAAIEAGAKPIGTARARCSTRDRRRRLLRARRSTRRAARPPSSSPPPCARRSPRRGAIARSRPGRARRRSLPKPAAARGPARAPADPGGARGRNRHRSPPRCCRSGRPGSCCCWRSRRRPRRSRAPRIGLAIALFVPIFPLGNVAQAAAVAYAALALAWLAVFWRDARAGLLFVAGPLLAAVGAIALLPLAVQPARGRAAAGAAGVRRRPRRRRRGGPARRAAAAHGLARRRISASTAPPASRMWSRPLSVVVQDNIGLVVVAAGSRARSGRCCRMPAGAA